MHTFSSSLPQHGLKRRPAASNGVEILESRVAPAAILIAGTAGNDSLMVIATSADAGTYQLNGGPVIPFAGATAFEFHGGDGDDLLTIVNPDGSVFAPSGGVSYAGEGHSSPTGDTLVVSGGGGQDFTQAWVLGATPDAGTIITGNGTVTQTLRYSGLEPVIDTVAAASLTINGNNANNAINYTQGTAAGRGLISVDLNETIEFANKTTLVINGFAGGDTINLNCPITPTGLTGITVDGGDPAAGDVLIFTSRPGAEDIRVTPSATDAGTVAGSGPLITFTGFDDLTVVGQTGDADILRAGGTVGADTYEVGFGAAPHDGTISGFRAGAGGFTFTPITFSGITSFIGPGVGFTAIDTVILNGTAGSDVLRYSDSTVFPGFRSAALNNHTELFFDFPVIVLRGLGGDDIFNLAFATTDSRALRIEGGDGSDRLNHGALANAATTIDLLAGTIVSTNANPITYVGVESLNQVSSGVASALTVTATDRDDTIEVTPTATGGLFTADLLPGMQFSYAGVGAAFTINGGAGFDLLNLRGTAAANAFTSNASAVFVSGSGVTIGTGLERLDVNGLEGNDNINLGTFTALPTQIFGGSGDDILVGSPQADLLDGGQGNDAINGGVGLDVLMGGDGNDVLDGGGGDDLILGGNQNDQIHWTLSSGGNDSTDGGAGDDLFTVFGTSGDDRVLILGGASITVIDLATSIRELLAGFERFNAVFDNGGADQLTFDNLARGGIQSINILLESHGTDQDSVTIATGAGDDHMAIGAPGEVKVEGDGPSFFIFNPNRQDRLILRGEEGDDRITSDASAASQMAVVIDLGPGQSGEITSFASGNAFGALSGYTVGKGPAAVATGDVNGDGFLDIVTVNAKSKNIAVLPGNSTGGFGNAVPFSTGGSKSTSVALANLDGDGDLDVAVTNSGSGTLAILANDGTGAFGAPTLINIGKKPLVVRAGDLDGDSDSDLAVLLGGKTLVAMSNDGSGAFTAGTPIKTGGRDGRDFVLGDFNADGDLDAAVAHFGTNNVGVVAGAAGADFAAATLFAVGIRPVSLAAGDHDGDGLTDLAVAHAGSRFLTLLHNDGVIDFTIFDSARRLGAALPGRIARALIVADVNQDGVTDLAILHAQGSIGLLLGLGAGQFRAPLLIDTGLDSTAGATALAIADFNRDGYVDLAIAAALSGEVSVALRVPA